MQRSEPVYCDDCTHVESSSRKQQPWHWLCLKAPRVGGYGYVVRGVWSGMPPFLYCRDLNAGGCSLHEQAAPGQMNLGVK